MIPAPQELPAERLVPHRPPMLLLTRLVEWVPKSSSAELSLPAGAPCFEGGDRFRSVFCAELLAQAVAAGVAYGAIAAGAPRAAAGSLLGLEDLVLRECSSVRPGATLRVESTLEVEIEPAAELSARLLLGKAELARGRLRVLVGGAPPLPPVPPAEPPPRLEGFMGGDFLQRADRSAICVGAGHPWIAGHFPDAPVLPAIGHLRYVEHAASLMLHAPCELESVARARFLEPVRPGDELDLMLTLRPPEVSWTFIRGKRAVSRGSGRIRR